MAKSPVVRITFVGDSTSAQKSVKDLAGVTGQAQVNVEGFGKTFLKMGLALEAGRMALQLVQRAIVGAISATTDYNTRVEQSEKIILGVTKSQQGLAEAQAVARKEEEAGRATYQQSISALAQLIPLSQRYGANLQELTQTQQILAAADPAQGLEGAAVALREALSGDFLSLVRRFEIPRATIQKLKDEGVPNLEIVRRALADLGYDQNFLSIANDNAAKKWDIFKGRITETAAVVEKPLLDVLIAGVEKLDHVLQSGGGKSFISLLVHDIQAITTGHFLDQWAVTIGQVLFLLADASNKITQTLTFGKVTIFSDEDMRNFRDNIIAAQGQIDADIQEHIAQPIADGLAGKTQSSPIAPAKLAGYGRDIIQAFLNGLTGAQVGDFESFTKQFEDLFKDDAGTVDTGRFTQATAVLAQALQDVIANGQITAKTFYDLSAVFGDNALNVATLTVRYGQQIVATNAATAATKALADEKARDAQVTAELAQRLVPYKQAIDAATAAEEAHAQAASDAAEAKRDQLEAVSRAAAETARRDAAAVQAAQDAASAHAAANQEREAAAQQELTDIQEQRKESAEKLYDTLVAGEQRALDAANHRVNALSAKAHKEDLGLLRQIQAAQDAGDTKKAAALRHQLENQKKRRQGETELAAAEQAVAQDEFDAADAQAKKEVARRDAAAAKDEEAAKNRLAAIQQEAKDQAAADAAVVKGAQDAAAADAERYRQQQEGIQDEIDAIGRAAKAQAKKDADAVTDATTVYNNQKIINDKIAIQLAGIQGWEEKRAGNAQDSATATKDMYDWLTKIYAIYAANPVGSPGGPPSPDQIAPQGGGTGGGARDEHSGAGQATPGGATLADNAAANRQAAIANWLGYYGPYNCGPAMFFDYTPPGFHNEPGATGPYWVRDGYSLDPSGTVALPTGQSPTSSAPGGRPGQQYLRTTEGGGAGAAAAPASAAGMTVHLHIAAPNLTDLGNPQQQRQFAGQAGEALRAWGSIVRGGGSSAA